MTRVHAVLKNKRGHTKYFRYLLQLYKLSFSPYILYFRVCLLMLQ